jgi:SAM-dependent methyltransferase
MTWREFWNEPHSIYVSARHRLLHYDRVAKDIAALIPSSESIALDYGCGEAGSADLVSQKCAKLYLLDAAPNVREKLRHRFGSEPKITVLDEDAFFALPDGSLDLIVCNSVLQYIRADEATRLIDIWHDKLKPGGRLVLGDVIPPDLGTLEDVKALLTFAFEGGFLFAALRGLVQTFFSNYRALREAIGLTTYTQDDMLALLSAHGFDAERAEHNIGHHQGRMTFVAEKIQSSAIAAI